MQTVKSVIYFFLGMVMSGLFFQATGNIKKSAGCPKEVLQVNVATVARGIGSVLEGEKDEGRRLAVIAGFVTPLVPGGEDFPYFFVYDYSGNLQVDPLQKKNEGKNMLDQKDARGKFFVRDFLAAAKKGGDFVEFFGKTQEEEAMRKKIAYLAPIPGTKYLLGSEISLAQGAGFSGLLPNVSR